MAGGSPSSPSSPDPGSGSGDPTPQAPSSDTVRGGERGERAIAAVGRGVRRLGRWAVRFAGESARAWRYLDFEQRVAAVGALLLIVSTFGPFSFVEAAIVLVGLAVLLLLKKRADGRSFHLPFGDGAVIMAAGAWSALLIVIRLFDRPLGQNLLALVCAAILVLAGLRMRLRRPMDDLPQERRAAAAAGRGEVDISFAPRADGGDTAETQALPRDAERTEPLREGAEPPPAREATAPRERPAPPQPSRERSRTVQRQTPAARRTPPPAVDPPTAVRPSEPPPPPPRERVDPDFDLPAPEERPPVGPPAPDDPPAEGPFRARRADEPPRRRDS